LELQERNVRPVDVAALASGGVSNWLQCACSRVRAGA